jgi:hypothetical protein
MHATTVIDGRTCFLYGCSRQPDRMAEVLSDLYFLFADIVRGAGASILCAYTMIWRNLGVVK